MIRAVVITLVIILVLTAIVLLYFQLRTVRTERDARQQTFAAGHLPDPLPDGLFSGQVLGYHGSWTGKTFDYKTKTGINNFSDGNQLYQFVFYEGVGLRDKNLQVIKIDYDQPGNPFWIRWITDEIVETESGQFLGKIHLRLFGYPFTIGYFSLRK